MTLSPESLQQTDLTQAFCRASPSGTPVQMTTAAAVAAAVSALTVPTAVGTAAASYMLSAATFGTSGLAGPQRLSLTETYTSAGVAITATPGSGTFGISLTAGTSLAIVTQAANSTTVTATALWEYTLPSTYVAGTNITVKVNTNYTLGGGTVGTHTLAMAAYLCADAGTMGSTIIATSAQTVAAAAGDTTFTITGTTLTSGARIVMTGVLVIQDTAGSNITAQINSVRLI